MNGDTISYLRGVMMRRLLSAARDYYQGLQRAIVMEGDAVRSSEKRAVSNWKAAFRSVRCRRVIARRRSRRRNPILRYTDRNRWQSQGRWIASLALAMTRRCERRSEIASFTIERDCSRRHETASASTQGADDPVPFSVSRKERMERREAPECLRGTLWRILARDSPASLTRADCESVSRDARVQMREGLRGLPPERCASRRSICHPEMTGWRWIIPPRHERGGMDIGI
jgi:hypothetical protein